MLDLDQYEELAAKVLRMARKILRAGEVTVRMPRDNEPPRYNIVWYPQGYRSDKLVMTFPIAAHETRRHTMDQLRERFTHARDSVRYGSNPFPIPQPSRNVVDEIRQEIITFHNRYFQQDKTARVAPRCVVLAYVGLTPYFWADRQFNAGDNTLLQAKIIYLDKSPNEKGYRVLFDLPQV